MKYKGFGRKTLGGTGGRLIEVTTLANNGPGSLREALETEGPRIIEFRVGGAIELEEELRIHWPYLTIDGSNAPSGGITIKNKTNTKRAIYVPYSHDIIFRHLRIRPGFVSGPTKGKDALAIQGGYNFVIDHCSLSWSRDENLGIGLDARNITVQYCIISEGLMPHSMGAIICCNGGLQEGPPYNISFHHNLLAHNNGRNPMIQTQGIVDVVNNVIYNPGWHASNLQDNQGPIKVNYVGNYLKYGANSKDIIDDPYLVHRTDDFAPTNGYEIFLKGNITPHRLTDDLPEDLAGCPDTREYVISTKHDSPHVKTNSTKRAYLDVLKNAGATLPARDEVDKRIVNDVINGTGQVVDDPSEVE